MKSEVTEAAAKRELQWGRDHLIAEMPDTESTPFAIITLQWGRDHLIAEMSPPKRA